MSRGFDTNINVAGKAQALAEAGVSFIGRYYNYHNHAKNLTRSEALALSASGIALVAVWEDGYPITGDYFTREKGLQDGQRAYTYARDTIQQPMNTPIYFAVDYDASSSELTGPITQYFQGVNTAFMNECSGKDIFDSPYQVGAYGSGATLQLLLAEQLISYAWLAQSTGWTGSRSFTKWNIRQGPETTIAGVPGDSNITVGHGGGWVVNETPPAKKENK